MLFHAAPVQAESLEQTKVAIKANVHETTDFMKYIKTTVGKEAARKAREALVREQRSRLA